MDDQYRITDQPTAETPHGTLRPMLWFGLILSLAGNLLASTLAGNPVVGSAFGLVALLCAIALIVHHYRTRAR